MAQWLRLCTLTARGTGSIPGGGTKRSHMLQDEAKNKFKRKEIKLFQRKGGRIYVVQSTLCSG